MRIHNFRAGFATNSSSSHSVILLSPDMVGRVREIASDDDDSFNWDFFRLTTQESKLRYLAAQLFTNYCEDKSAVADFLSKLGDEIPEYRERYEEDMLLSQDRWDGSVSLPYVDHQSVLGLPGKYDPEFVAGLIEYFKSPKVVVLGGNDNSDEDDHARIRPADSEDVDFFNAIRDRSGSGMKVRRDGEFYTMFNIHDGNKMRLSFDTDNPVVQDYIKSSAPELVDVKITDRCGFGCKFCYQGSTIQGKHADFADIKKIAKLLGEMNVFEVAIGGGEPTEHPQFAEILEEFFSQGIVPNFTTFSNKWLNNERIVNAVKEFSGGIGVSCLSAKDLDQVKEIAAAVSNGGFRSSNGVMAQHVIGSVPMHVTAEFLDQAFSQYIPVLLLGYKSTGFGANYQRHDDSSLETYLKLAMTKEYGWVRLSVDTALVDQYPTLPQSLGAPKALVSSPEGKFSCYIDAVTGKMAASSYVPVGTMEDLELDKNKFLNKFARY